MEEELTCTVCHNSWRRLKVRGRKPLACPSCSDLDQTLIVSLPKDSISKNKDQTKKEISNITPHIVYNALHPKPSNYKDLLESTKKGSVWKCPSCGYVLELSLPVIDVPTHRCTPDAINIKPFERLS